MKLKSMIAAGALAAGLVVPAMAQDVSFVAHYDVGLEYDGSIVAVGGIPISKDGDFAFRAEGGFGIEGSTSSNGRFALNYSYTGTRQFDISTNDGDLQLFTGSFVQSFGGGYLAGVVAARGEYDLDGSDFLSMNRYSGFFYMPAPKVGGQLRFTAGLTEKSFDTGSIAVGRDADNTEYGISYRRNAGPGRLTVGVSVADESADTRADLSYDSTTFEIDYDRLSLGQLAGHDLTGTLSLSFEDREYGAPSPLLGVAREDERLSLGFEAEWEISDTRSLTAEVSYDDIASNQSSIDDSAFGVSLRYRHQFRR